MLIVERKSRQGIKIGENVEVYVAVDRGRIKLFTKAPRHIDIDRIDENGNVEEDRLTRSR